MLRAILKSAISLSLCASFVGAQIISTSQYGVTFTEPVVVAPCATLTFWECTFIGPGVLLSLPGYNSVCIWNCKFLGTNPNQFWVQGATGIWATRAIKLWASGNTFWGLKVGVMNDAEWVYTDAWIAYNSFWNSNTRYSDGAGGWLNASDWGVALCMMRVNGWNAPDGSHHAMIEFNQFFNRLGVDEVSDQINLWETNHFIIRGNNITGAKGQYGRFGMNANGIVTDDPWSDGSPGIPDPNQTSRENVIEDNFLSNASIGVGAGLNNICRNNYVYNSGLDVFGRWFPVPFVGVGRYNREGDSWAQTNLVSGNQAYSATKWGDNPYSNEAGPLNWINNVGI